MLPFFRSEFRLVSHFWGLDRMGCLSRPYRKWPTFLLVEASWLFGAWLCCRLAPHRGTPLRARLDCWRRTWARPTGFYRLCSSRSACAPRLQAGLECCDAFSRQTPSTSEGLRRRFVAVLCELRAVDRCRRRPWCRFARRASREYR